VTRTSRERMNLAPRSMDVCIRGDLGSNAGSSISISLPAVTRILGAGALRKLNTIFFFCGN